MNPENQYTEEIRVDGAKLVDEVKRLIQAGNVRRILIKNAEGKELLDIPLTFGVVGVAILPVLAAVGAIAALALSCTIVIEKQHEVEEVVEKKQSD